MEDVKKEDVKKFEKVFLTIASNGRNKNDLITNPKFELDNNSSFIKWGKDNNYPEFLVELFNKSTIHSSIINTRVEMMLGDGFIQSEDVEFSERTDKFIKRCNKYESLDDMVRKLFYDQEIFGLCYIEVTYNKNGEPILNHIDASKIRQCEVNDENQIVNFKYSEKWSKYNFGYDVIDIPAYDPEKKQKRSLIYISRYTPTNRYYAYPSYISAVKSILIDAEIDNFHLSNLENGLTPSFFVGYPSGEGITKEERSYIKKQINDNMTGTDNAGKFFIAFYDQEGKNKPEIQVLETSNIDKMFEIIGKTSQTKILMSHRVVNENLVGISTPGKLGSTKEIIQNYSLYYNQTIKPSYKKILEKLNDIFLQYGYNEIKLLKSEPLSQELSENILATILTKDELREIIGYDSIENVQVNQTKLNKEYKFDSIDETNITDVTEDDLEDYFIWISNEKEPCPACAENKGKMRKLSDWLEIGIPRVKNNLSFNGLRTNFATSPYSTYCEDNCRCQLKRV